MAKPVNINIKNRKAKFEFHLLDKYEAGIVLTGTEIKSIRESKVSLTEAFCAFQGDELFIHKMRVERYEAGTYNNHEPMRTRKLLLKRQELRKIQKRIEEKGMTVVPYRLYMSERGFIKVEIFTAKGKKSHDKRDSIRDRESKRQLDRIKKYS